MDSGCERFVLCRSEQSHREEIQLEVDSKDVVKQVISTFSYSYFLLKLQYKKFCVVSNGVV